MSADVLLSKLVGVRATGRNHQWLARCSAHDDCQPSLSIRELDDGRILLHCFAGCSAREVLDAAGLDFDALYPERAIDHRRPPERRPFPAADMLCAVATETLVAAIVSADMVDGYLPDARDHARLVIAAGRLLAAVQAAGLDSEGERIRRSLSKHRGARLDCEKVAAHG